MVEKRKVFVIRAHLRLEFFHQSLIVLELLALDF